MALWWKSWVIHRGAGRLLRKSDTTTSCSPGFPSGNRLASIFQQSLFLNIVSLSALTALVSCPLAESAMHRITSHITHHIARHTYHGYGYGLDNSLSLNTWLRLCKEAQLPFSKDILFLVRSGAGSIHNKWQKRDFFFGRRCCLSERPLWKCALLSPCHYQLRMTFSP